MLAASERQQYIDAASYLARRHSDQASIAHRRGWSRLKPGLPVLDHRHCPEFVLASSAGDEDSQRVPGRSGSLRSLLKLRYVLGGCCSKGTETVDSSRQTCRS